MSKANYKIGARTAMAIVISTMIGTGVFTSLGFQLAEVQNTWTIILLWVIGGIFALIGAFTYAELGTHFKESGGDYIFLSRIFHPIFGYLYAWTSLTAGFSAPIAISALAMTDYVAEPLGLGPYAKWLGIGVILVLSMVHSATIKVSGTFQDYSSLLKVLFVLALIAIGVFYLPYESSALAFDNSWTKEIWKPGFAVSLIYVSYAYQGWNSAAYIVDEIKEPRKNLPVALIGGTTIVMLVYIALQVIMLKHSSLEQMAGQVNVTTISFGNIFGERGTMWISLFIGFQLIATISSYLWIGSRITQSMATEHSLWSYLSVKSENNIPVRAIWVQAVISIGLALTVSLEQVMLYAGFILHLMSMLTIFSSFFIKPKEGTFKSPFGRTLQVIYLVFSFIVLIYILYERPVESMLGFLLLAVGLGTYFLGTAKIREED